jgi:hypothetical protein
LADSGKDRGLLCSLADIFYPAVVRVSPASFLPANDRSSRAREQRSGNAFVIRAMCFGGARADDGQIDRTAPALGPHNRSNRHVPNWSGTVVCGLKPQTRMRRVARPGTEYWLIFQQAMVICSLSRTQRAGCRGLASR